MQSCCFPCPCPSFSLLLYLSKPIAFLAFSLPLPSLLHKLPTVGFVTGLSSTEAPLCFSEAGDKIAEHDTDNYFYWDTQWETLRRRENWPSNANITVADICQTTVSKLL